MDVDFNRRKFLNVISVTGAALATGLPTFSMAIGQDDKPAVLGGPKAHGSEFPNWPVYDHTEENKVSEVLHSKAWGRLDGNVDRKSTRLNSSHVKISYA